MEWCIRDSTQITVLTIAKVDLHTTPCPACAKKRFASVVHTVQHIESGFCTVLKFHPVDLLSPTAEGRCSPHL